MCNFIFEYFGLRRLATKKKTTRDFSETSYSCQAGVHMFKSEIKKYGPRTNFGDRAPSMLTRGEIFLIFVNTKYCYLTNRKSLDGQESSSGFINQISLYQIALVFSSDSSSLQNYFGVHIDIVVSNSLKFWHFHEKKLVLQSTFSLNLLYLCSDVLRF